MHVLNYIVLIYGPHVKVRSEGGNLLDIFPLFFQHFAGYNIIL